MTRAGTAGGTWRSVVRTGALWGGGAVFLALVGLVEAVSRRQIVAGVLSLSYTFILLAGFGSGVQVSRRWAGLAAWQRLAGGAAAGALAGVLVGLLVVIGRLANLRPMLINASLPLYEILSFGRGLGGLPLMVLVQAAAGAIGAAMLLLPPAVRRPVIVGLGTAFVIGLFQDLVQLMLQSGVRAGLRSLLFTGEGLAPRGAVILMVLAAGGEYLLDSLPLAGETVGRQAGAPAPPGPARDHPGRAGGRHPHVALGDWSLHLTGAGPGRSVHANGTRSQPRGGVRRAAGPGVCGVFCHRRLHRGVADHHRPAGGGPLVVVGGGADRHGGLPDGRRVLRAADPPHSGRLPGHRHPGVRRNHSFAGAVRLPATVAGGIPRRAGNPEACAGRPRVSRTAAALLLDPGGECPGGVRRRPFARFAVGPGVDGRP